MHSGLYRSDLMHIKRNVFIKLAESRILIAAFIFQVIILKTGSVECALTRRVYNKFRRTDVLCISLKTIFL